MSAAASSVVAADVRERYIKAFPRGARASTSVRAGGVFRCDRTRWATVIEVFPAGRAQLRISGYRGGNG